MPVGPINPRAYEHVADTIRLLALDQAEPRLVTQFRSINVVNPSRIDEQVFANLLNRVSQLENYHEQQPFIVAPPHVIDQGEFSIATQQATATPVTLTREDLARHTIVASTTGGGKTTFTLHVAQKAIDAGIHVWSIDPKGDALALAARNDAFLRIHRGFRFNPLQRLPYLPVSEQIAAFTTIFARCFYGAEHTKQVLNEALHNAFKKHDQPSLADLREDVDGLYSTKETYSRRDAIRGVSLRLQRINDLFPGLFTCRHGLSFPTLANHSLYLPITLDMESVGQFLATYLIHHLYLYQRHAQRRGGLTHLVSIDEGLQTLGNRPNTIDGLPTLSHLQSLVREFGIGMMVTTTSITLTDPLLRSNTSTQVVMRLSNPHELSEIARSLALTPAQTEYLSRDLMIGECIIRMPSWSHAILARFPPLGYDKTVSTEEWSAALERTDLLTPPEPAAPTLASDEPSRQVKESSPTTPGDTLALTTAEEQLLKSIVQEILPATEHYERLSLHPQTGTSAKNKLLTLDLIKEEKIVIRTGRGGTALALTPTPRGITRSGIHPPKRTRGGDSVQHQYLVQELAATILKSTVECIVGTKSVDLLIKYNAQVHGRLRDYLGAHATAGPNIAPNGIALNEGDLAAIEVEVSDPLKTAPENIGRNRQAGIALTVVAVLPKTLPTTITGLKTRVSADLNNHFLVVNALGLLDHLRNQGKEV